jgi:hypothetical protein
MKSVQENLQKVTKSLLAALVISLCSGCAIQQRVSGVNNTFLEDVDITSTRPNVPFSHAWVNSAYRRSDFESVYFEPIRLEYLPKDQWKNSASAFVETEQEYMHKVREIAAYFREELLTETSSDSSKRLSLASGPGPGTLVVTIALTELELSHPVARAGSLIAPVPGTGPAIAAVTDPHVAFAARFTDGATGKLVATAADRKFAPTRFIDLNKLTVSSSAREITALWAATFAAILQSDGTTKVEGMNYDWMPW